MTGVCQHPYGPRVYLAGFRVHHGSAGCALVAAAGASGTWWLAALGALLVAHDGRDFPWRDRDNHEA